MSLKHLSSIRTFEIESILSILDEINIKTDTAVILEIGSGAGWQAKMLSEHGYKVEAIDMVDSNYTKDRIWPITDYDGRHIPFPEEHFDIVFSSSVMEHIPHVEQFQDEIKRVLKTDGIAIHILPNSMWRFWTIMAHYPFMFISALQAIYKKIIPIPEPKNRPRNNIQTARDTSGKFESLKKILFPSRRGETGSAITEIYHFSTFRWRRFFIKNGWVLKKIVSNKLFYTGYMVFGSLISLNLRQYMSRFLGSVCHIYVMKKVKKESF